MLRRGANRTLLQWTARLGNDSALNARICRWCLEQSPLIGREISPKLLPGVEVQRFSVAPEAQTYDSDFLSERLRISPPDFQKLCAGIKRAKEKPQRVFHPSRLAKIKSNLEFLREVLGMDVDRQRKLVLACPRILTYSPTTSRKKAEWFATEVGLDKQGIRRIFASCPELLTVSIDKDVKPLVAFLLRFGFTKTQLKACILQAPKILTLSQPDCVEPLLKKFLDLGLTKADVVSAINSQPEMLLRNFDLTVKRKVRWFREILGPDQEPAVQQLLSKNTHIFTHPMDVLKGNYEWLKELGFNKQKCGQLIQASPNLLRGDVEEKQERMNFAREFLGEKLEELMLCSSFFTRSFEDRVLLRVGFLDFRRVKYRDREPKDVFVDTDKVFLRLCHGASMEDYMTFKSYWAGLSKEGKIEALRKGRYNV